MIILPSTSAGVISTSKKTNAIPVPVGIPVASTNQIIVNGEVFTKGYNNDFFIYRGELGDEYFGCISDCGSSSIEDRVYFDGVVWRYDINHLNGSFYDRYSSHIATNPSNNPNFVPTTGWTPSINLL